jgi:hypothetical protein
MAISDKTLYPLNLARWALVAVLSIVFVVEVWLSLEWRMGTDSPLLHYIAFLINEHDYVPYRDVFETSMPGTFLFHLTIVKLFGYSETAFRIVDMASVVLAMTLAWLTVRRIDTLSATVGVLSFALLYLGYGIDLQRDYVGFVAMLGALYGATRRYKSPYTGALVIGVLGGLAATIKPQLALGLSVLLLYYTAQLTRPEAGTYFRDLVRYSLTAGVALLAIFVLPLLWLAANGGLASFWEMLTNYLPLHVDMTGNIETVTTQEKLTYIQRKLSSDLPFFLIPATIGIGIALFAGNLRRDQKQLVLVLAGLAGCYIISTIMAAQFWLYHWVPFRMLAVLCTALMLVPLRSFRLHRVAEFGLLLTFCLCLMIWTRTFNPLTMRIMLPPAFAQQIHGQEPPAPKGGRVAEIAEFLLAANLQPDDRVQPLDWTEGSLHAMLLARAIVATPYIYNYHFYHYVSNPYIQTMRLRLMQQLQANKPRFLIEVDDELRPAGIDTTDSFPELENFVQQNYVVVHAGDEYRIYERKHIE